MTRWLMLWKMNSLAVPADPEQAAKLWLAMNDVAKSTLPSGGTWGTYTDASGGFAFWEDTGSESDLIDILGVAKKLMPFVTCDVRPVLDADQARKMYGGA